MPAAGTTRGTGRPFRRGWDGQFTNQQGDGQRLGQDAAGTSTSGGGGTGGAVLHSEYHSVSPLSHGAVGDGVTNDLAALQAAFAAAVSSNKTVDGGDLVYGVSGNLTLTSLTRPWIRALRLKQLAPSEFVKTIYFLNCESIQIEALEVDRGTDGTSGGYESAGLWIDGGSNHSVSDVEVFGDGKGNGIAIWNTASSTYSNLRVRDMEYNAPTATDDIMHGIWLVYNDYCNLVGPVVSDLGGNGDATFGNRYTRGIAAGGNTHLTIVSPKVRNVDQGIDLSSSELNAQCVVQGGHTYQCVTVGVKLANSNLDNKVMGHIAERCGMFGFHATGPAEVVAHPIRDNEFEDCKAIDIGWNAFPFPARGPMGPCGFLVWEGDFQTDYPIGMRFKDCYALDRQGVPTMFYGFWNGIAYNPAVDKYNELVDCVSEGHTVDAEFGWHASSVATVTYTDITGVPTDTFLGRDTAGTGAAEAMSVATAKGLLSLAGTNSGDQTITLTGDVTGTGTGSFAATLATVNSNTGTYGGAATVAQVSVNGKGLITGVTAVGIAAPWAGITGIPAAVTALSGTNTGDQTNITGNAGTATALETARTINGVSFNGTANITINAVDATARQPLDADLTEIAALTTTAFGRGFLDLADAAAARTKLELGTAALSASGDFQPINAHLTAIAALAGTTAFGRDFLNVADAAAGRAKLALGSASLAASGDFQPVDADLTAIAALATTAYGRDLLTTANQAALTALIAAATTSLSGAMSAADKTKLDAVASGTYTPARVLLNNLDAVSVSPCQYMRVGDTVTVSGRIDIDPTGAGGVTRFSLTLPIASTFTQSYQAGGVCTSNADAATQQSFAIFAQGSVVWFEGRNTATTSIGHWFTFTYQVL